MSELHRKLEALPRLHVEGTSLHGLIVAAARHAGVSPIAWLSTRVAAMADAELGRSDDGPDAEAEALSTLFYRLAGSVPYEDAHRLFHRLRHRSPDLVAQSLEAAAHSCIEELPQPLRAAIGRRAVLLYDPSSIRPAGKDDDERRMWADRLLASGYEREIPRTSITMVRALERLLEDAPHMREPTEFVLGQLAAARCRGELRLPPILLSGPPAAGKTWWAERVADALGIPSTLIAMPGVTSSFELAGGSGAWHRSQPGRIVRTLIDTGSACPLFVLDEIDKINPGNYDPSGVLLHLVERATARRWRDEFFDAEFDVSRALIVATANLPDRMDPALRSRFREFAVASPRRADRGPIIESMWRSYRRDAGLGLPATLPGDVIAHLSDRFTDAREMQRAFDAAIGRAARRPGRLALMPADFGAPAAQLVRAGQAMREVAP